MARVQELTERLDEIADSGARESAEELVSAVIELYGEGLERIFAVLEEAGDEAAELREALTADGVVASLMLIHGLFPVDLASRVAEALDGIRPYLESHGGDVELLGVEDGIARLRLQGSCKTCPASSATLELAVKQALDEAAPDLDGMQVEGIEAPGARPATDAVSLPVLQVAPGNGSATPSWFDLNGVGGLSEGELRALDVAGVPIAVALVDGALLAYRDACAGCGASLADGALDPRGAVACGACGRRFDLPRAGLSLDGEQLQLEPVPLLEGADGVRVALAA